MSGSSLSANSTTPTAVDRSWRDPNVEAVVPGVHRIPLPLPGDALAAINVYAIEDDRGLVLVDAGWNTPDSRRSLEKGLASFGATVGDIHSLLITHLHRDHFGQATALGRATGAAVRLDRGEERSFRWLMRPPAPDEPRDILGMVRGGAEELFATDPDSLWPREIPDADEPTWMKDEVRLVFPGHEIEVVRTPGHTWGHVCFLDRERGLLLAGDHVLPHITPSIGVEAPQRRLSLGRFLRSLTAVRNLPVTGVLPAHGPVFTNLSARVDELVDHHAARLEATHTAVSEGARTGLEVARELRWTRRAKRLEELDLFNKVLAVRESVAHLDHLVSRRRLTRADKDGVALYEVRSPHPAQARGQR